jgi:hypothetical protein
LSLYSAAMDKYLYNEKSLRSLLQPLGLLLIGSLKVAKEDNIPDISTKLPARQLLLIGNGGSSLWPVFNQSPEYQDAMPDPLDRWSRRVGGALAEELGGRAIFPFEGPPHPPFLSWAAKTGKVVSSRLALFIHEHYGLWHAYRFALAIPQIHEQLLNGVEYESPCLSCEDQPCLEACPVDAFANQSYQADLCMDYLLSDATSACCDQGCAARRACPVGKSFAYLPAHAKFHMDAYVKPHIK